MATEYKDVLRLEGTQGASGLEGYIRNRQTAYENESTYRQVHQYANGTRKYWTPDGHVAATGIQYSNGSYPSVNTVQDALDQVLTSSIGMFSETGSMLVAKTERSLDLQSNGETGIGYMIDEVTLMTYDQVALVNKIQGGLTAEIAVGPTGIQVEGRTLYNDRVTVADAIMISDVTTGTPGRELHCHKYGQTDAGIRVSNNNASFTLYTADVYIKGSDNTLHYRTQYKKDHVWDTTILGGGETSLMVLNETGLQVNEDIYTTPITDYSSTSTVGGFSSTALKKIYYKKIGKEVIVWFAIDGTSNANNFTFTVPFTAASVGNDEATVNSCACQVVNNGANQTSPGFLYLDTGTATAILCLNFDPDTYTGWATSNGKGAVGCLRYTAA